MHFHMLGLEGSPMNQIPLEAMMNKALKYIPERVRASPIMLYRSYENTALATIVKLRLEELLTSYTTNSISYSITEVSGENRRVENVITISTSPNT